MGSTWLRLSSNGRGSRTAHRESGRGGEDTSWQGCTPSAISMSRVRRAFLLYNYSFRPPGVVDAGTAPTLAGAAGVVCSDEFLLHPDPYPTRADWCRARVARTQARQAACDPALPTPAGEPFPPDQGADRGAASSRVRAVAPHHSASADWPPPWSTGTCTFRGPSARPGCGIKRCPSGIRANGSGGASLIRCCARASRPGSSGDGRRPVIEDLLSTVVEVKESVYKAWFPLTGRPLDILDAFVRLDPARGCSRPR